MSGLRQASIVDAEPSADNVHIETDGRVIRPALAPVDALVDEARLAVTDDGLATTMTDSANVAMVELRVSADAFEEFDHQGDAFTTGIDMDRLTTVLAGARLGKRTRDPVALTIDRSHIHTTIEREYDTTTVERTEEFLAMDSAAIRESDDLPDIDYPWEATVGVPALSDTLGALDRRDFDHARVAVRDGELTIGGAHTRDDGGETLTVDGIRASFGDVATGDGEPVESLFSMDYLTDTVDAMADAKVDSASLSVGDELPLVVAFSREEDDTELYHGRMMLAPRISSEDGP